VNIAKLNNVNSADKYILCSTLSALMRVCHHVYFVSLVAVGRKKARTKRAREGFEGRDKGHPVERVPLNFRQACLSSHRLLAGQRLRRARLQAPYGNRSILCQPKRECNCGSNPLQIRRGKIDVHGRATAPRCTVEGHRQPLRGYGVKHVALDPNARFLVLSRPW